jgi:transposase
MLQQAFGDECMSRTRSVLSGTVVSKQEERRLMKIPEVDDLFFDWQGVIHHEFVPRGQTVNKEFYIAVLKRLREAVRRKRPQLWMNQIWVLHHNNAPAHLSFLVRNFLAKNEMTVVPQPPYSPDLAPADFFLFPKLKSTLKGRHFDTINEIQKNSTDEFAIPKKLSRKRSRVGRNVGSGVLLVKETTLKATNLNKLYLST